MKFCLDGKADNLFVSEISRLGRTIKIIVATIERENIANRLHSGREIAKANGVHFGRKQGQIIKTHKDKEREYSKVLRDLRQGLSVAKVAKIHSVSESTVKRLKKEFGI